MELTTSLNSILVGITLKSIPGHMGPVDEAVRVCRAADAMEAVYKPHCMQCFGEITLPGGSIFACGCFTCDKCLPSPRSCPEHGAASAHPHLRPMWNSKEERGHSRN